MNTNLEEACKIANDDALTDNQKAEKIRKLLFPEESVANNTEEPTQ